MGASTIIPSYSQTSFAKGRGNRQKFLMYRLLQHKEKTRSYVVPMLGNLANWDPFMLKKSPHQGQPQKNRSPRQKTQASTLPPSSLSPQPYKPLYLSMPEMQPEPLFLLLEAVGGPLGITRVHTPSSLFDFNQCHTCLGRFSHNLSWFTKEFQLKSLPWTLNSSKPSY